MKDKKVTVKKASKARLQERFRVLVQAFSFAFHNGYVMGWIKKAPYAGANKALCLPGLNCYSCPGAIGACPIGSLQAVLDSGTVKISLYVLGFIGAVGMLCGRFVCGWLCPFGAVQDLLYRVPLFKKIKNLPGHKYIRWLKYVVLVVFVIVLPMVVTGPSGSGQPWFCEWICPSGTLLGGIPLYILNANLRSAAGLRFIWKLAILLLILIGSVKLYRPFCKYLCPLGALYGSCNKLSLYRLTVSEEKCVSCGACQKACGMDIPVWKNPNSVECIRCGKCMAACPTGALSSTWKDLFDKKSLACTDKAGRLDAPAATVSPRMSEGTAADEATPVAPNAANPESVKTAPANRSRFVGLSLWAIIILAVCACSLLFNGSQVVAYTVFGNGADFVNFFTYIGGPVSSVFAATCGIVYGILMLKNLKKRDKDGELKELAKYLPLLAVACCALITLATSVAILLMNGPSWAAVLAALKLDGLNAGFWIAPSVLIALSGLWYRSKKQGVEDRV